MNENKERFMTTNEIIDLARKQRTVYGQRGVTDTYFQMSKTDRDAFDAMLVQTKDPLAYEPGTTEHRFRIVVNRA